MHFSQKDNLQKYHAGAPHIEMSFPRYPSGCDYIEYRECGLPEETRNYTGLQTCEQFGVSCTYCYHFGLYKGLIFYRVWIMSAGNL